MTKGVRSLPAARSDPGHLQTSADDTVKDGPALICLIGRLVLQKYLSTLALRSSLFQIAQYCFAGLAQQGQFGNRARLRVPHANDLFLPVNVLQTQRDDFAGSQAVSGQQHQKGVIPSSNRRAVLTSRFHNGLNLLGTQRRRNLLIVIDPWSDHGTAQIEGGSSAAMQIAQEASKAHRVALDRSPTPTLATLLQVRIDIPNAQVCKALLLTTRPQLSQELQRVCCTLRPRHRCQSAQLPHPRVISSYQIAVKCLDGRHWGGCNGPMSMHQPQEHVMAVLLRRRHSKTLRGSRPCRIRQLRSSQHMKSSHSGAWAAPTAIHFF